LGYRRPAIGITHPYAAKKGRMMPIHDTMRLFPNRLTIMKASTLSPQSFARKMAREAEKSKLQRARHAAEHEVAAVRAAAIREIERERLLPARLAAARERRAMRVAFAKLLLP
jgi:hypothetical protein